MSLEDILLLLVHLYSLAGGGQENQLFPAELEDRLKSVIAEILVCECDSLSEKLQDFGTNVFFQLTCLTVIEIFTLVGVPVDEVKAHRAAQKIVEQLHYISGARCHMKRYRYFNLSAITHSRK